VSVFISSELVVIILALTILLSGTHLLIYSEKAHCREHCSVGKTTNKLKCWSVKKEEKKHATLETSFGAGHKCRHFALPVFWFPSCLPPAFVFLSPMLCFEHAIETSVYTSYFIDKGVQT